LVLLLLGSGLNALPGELPLEEVDQGIANTLQIVAPGLFDSLVGVHARISCCPDHPLVLDVWDVFSVFTTIIFSKSEVDDVKVLPGLPQPDDEILWLDVPVDDILLVEHLHPADHLVAEH